MANKRPIVFVSCGQRTQEERDLGTQIGELVTVSTAFEPYYAEEQATFEGLTKHILAALYRCAGFVAVLHPRGKVAPMNLVRASVWIEQEIAVAAFIQQVLARPINVASYVHESVGREGMREQLLLNSKSFANNNQVLEHLKTVLPTWMLPDETKEQIGIRIDIKYETRLITRGRHDYCLLVLASNSGNEPIELSHVDLEFPCDLMELPAAHPMLVSERSTLTTCFFRAERESLPRIYPGDVKRVLTIDYHVDHDIFLNKRHLFGQSATATAYPVDGSPEVAEKPIAQLQIF